MTEPSSLRDQLRQSRRRSRVSTAAIALAEGTLEMAMEQHRVAAARQQAVQHGDEKACGGAVKKGDFLNEQRAALEKENVALQKQIIRERIAHAGESVPFGNKNADSASVAVATTAAAAAAAAAAVAAATAVPAEDGKKKKKRQPRRRCKDAPATRTAADTNATEVTAAPLTTTNASLEKAQGKAYSYHPSSRGARRQLEDQGAVSFSSSSSSSSIDNTKKRRETTPAESGCSPWRSEGNGWHTTQTSSDSLPFYNDNITTTKTTATTNATKNINKKRDTVALANTLSFAPPSSSKTRRPRNLKSKTISANSNRVAKPEPKSDDPWEHFTKPTTVRRNNVITKWRAQTSSLHHHRPVPGLEGPELVVRLICAEEVLALDRMTGTSDPIAFMFCGSESYQSDIKKGTVNPYWNAEFRFGGKRQDIRTVSELHVQIKDDDGSAKSCHRKVASSGDRVYDNLGGVTVDLEQVRNTSSRWSKPKWYVLKPLKGMGMVRGRVRLSLRYFSMPESVISSVSSSKSSSAAADDSLDKLMMMGEAAIAVGAGDQSAPPPPPPPPINPEEADDSTTNAISSCSRRGKVVKDTSNAPVVTETTASGRLLHDVHVLSSFRSKARAELKSMAKKIEQQSAELKKAQQMVQQAQEDAKLKQGRCEERGAKITELAHTIEMLQVHGGCGPAMHTSHRSLRRRPLGRRSQQRQDNRSWAHGETAVPAPPASPQQTRQRLHHQENATAFAVPPPPHPPPPPPPFHFSGRTQDHTGIAAVDQDNLGLCFDDQQEFSIAVTQSLHRLRDSSTRSAAQEELRNIADGLSSAKSRVVWRCLRVAESDTNVSFQRECASIFATMAQRAPRACSGTLVLAFESLCRRIMLGGNDSRKNEALVQSASAFSLHVIPIVLAGKVQPSLMPMMRPFLDVVRRYPHAQAGAVAAQCVGAMLLPSQPRITVERFQIFGIDVHHNNSESVLRRMLLSSVPTLSCPAKVSVNPHERAMNIDVPAEDGVRFYNELLKNLHYLPDKWKVAASSVRSVDSPPQGGKITNRRKRKKKAGSHHVAARSVELNQRHMRLVAACAGELLHVSAPLIQLFCESQGMARVALFDVVGKLCEVASNGLKVRENRIAKAIVAAGTTILQLALDTLLLENRSFIWKQRRAALHCIRHLADLDGVILGASAKRVMRRSLPTIFDASVDANVIRDAISFAKHDKVNVVRAAAADALRGLDRLENTKNGEEQIKDTDTMPHMSTEGFGIETNERGVQAVVREVVDEEEKEMTEKVQASQRPPVHVGEGGTTTHSQSREYGQHTAACAAPCRTSATERPHAPPSIADSLRHRERRQNEGMRQYTSSELDSQFEGDECEAKSETSENTYTRLLGRLSDANARTLDLSLRQSTANGDQGLFDVLVECLTTSKANADDQHIIMRHIIVELVDDGQMVAAAFGMLARKLARRGLGVIAGVLEMLTSHPLDATIDLAFCRILRWVYAAINSNHWCALDIVQGVGEWHTVRDAMRRLSANTSEFSRKIHAAKIYALLRSVMLLEAHLGIFAVRPRTDSEEDSEEEEDDDSEEKEAEEEDSEEVEEDWQRRL
jgi:hypothetical protein